MSFSTKIINADAHGKQDSAHKCWLGEWCENLPENLSLLQLQNSFHEDLGHVDVLLERPARLTHWNSKIVQKARLKRRKIKRQLMRNDKRVRLGGGKHFRERQKDMNSTLKGLIVIYPMVSEFFTFNGTSAILWTWQTNCITHFVTTNPCTTNTMTSVTNVPARKNVWISLLFHKRIGALQHFMIVNFMM